MMEKQKVIEFFDSLAETWDEHLVIDEEIIRKILDNVGVKEGDRILDVACGTGVLIPFYLERGASFVTAIDISPRMCEIAGKKNENEKVKIICDDVFLHPFEESYDRIVIYNAFPHFDDPEGLIRILSDLLKENGTLTVAHGMSREKVLLHHRDVMDVSRILPEIADLGKMMEESLNVTVAVSDDKMYQAVGKRR